MLSELWQLIACQPSLDKHACCMQESNELEQALQLLHKGITVVSQRLKQGMRVQVCIKADLAKLPSTQMTSIQQMTVITPQACQPHTQMLRQVPTKDDSARCHKPSFLSLSIVGSLKEKAVLIMESSLSDSGQEQNPLLGTSRAFAALQSLRGHHCQAL